MLCKVIGGVQTSNRSYTFSDVVDKTENILNFAFFNLVDSDRIKKVRYKLEFTKYNQSWYSWSPTYTRGIIKTSDGSTDLTYTAQSSSATENTITGTYPTSFTGEIDKTTTINYTQTTTISTPNWGKTGVKITMEWDLYNSIYNVKKLKVFTLKNIWEKLSAYLFGMLPTGERRDGN